MRNDILIVRTRSNVRELTKKKIVFTHKVYG